MLALGLFVLAGLGAAWEAHNFGWPDDLMSSPLNAQAMAEARSGLMFLSTPNHDTCRELSFDNSTGAQRDDGVVDCKIAVLKVRQNDAVARLNAIGSAFRSR